jgi:hypothetical protein
MPRTSHNYAKPFPSLSIHCSARCWMQRYLSILFAAICWTISPLASAETYQGVDLFTISVPDGFESIWDITTMKASGGQVVSYTSNPDGELHALLWNSSGTAIDLHPDALGTISQSKANFTNGALQVGIGLTYFGTENALLWNGSAGSAVNLQPTNLPNISQSRAFGTDGVQQVGVGLTTGGFEHALLWNGSAGSAVDLHPTNLSGIAQSRAFATNGGQQSGVGLTNGNLQHALLWSGTAGSAVDLHPRGFVESITESIFGTQQAGIGKNNEGLDNAVVWNGTANSAINLHPVQLENIVESRAFATNGLHQAGAGLANDGSAHAMLWSGTAASAIDLHALLPPASQFIASTADTIDAEGNVYGTAMDEYTNIHAIRWSPILPGDFNDDHEVDAGDYVTWRKGLGTSYTPAYYDVWRTHFGNTMNSAPPIGAHSEYAVPEPSIEALLATAVPNMLRARRRHRSLPRRG